MEIGQLELYNEKLTRQLIRKLAAIEHGYNCLAEMMYVVNSATRHSFQFYNDPLFAEHVRHITLLYYAMKFNVDWTGANKYNAALTACKLHGVDLLDADNVRYVTDCSNAAAMFVLGYCQWFSSFAHKSSPKEKATAEYRLYMIERAAVTYDELYDEYFNR